MAPASFCSVEESIIEYLGFDSASPKQVQPMYRCTVNQNQNYSTNTTGTRTNQVTLFPTPTGNRTIEVNFAGDVRSYRARSRAPLSAWMLDGRTDAGVTCPVAGRSRVHQVPSARPTAELFHPYEQKRKNPKCFEPGWSAEKYENSPGGPCRRAYDTAYRNPRRHTSSIPLTDRSAIRLDGGTKVFTVLYTRLRENLRQLI